MKNGTAIERLDGTLVRGRITGHVRTLTGRGRTHDIDTYRLATGEVIECITPTSDCRVRPVEVESVEGAYPMHDAGE